MRHPKAIAIASSMSVVMILTAIPVVAKDKTKGEQVRDQQRVAQSSGTDHRFRSSRTSFSEYIQAHRDAHAQKTQELRERYEFQDRYLGNGE